MSRQSVINDMAENGRMSRAEAARMFEQTFESLERVLAPVGSRVVIAGFGKFERRMTKRTIARNPKTNEQIAITPRAITRFSETKVRR